MYVSVYILVSDGSEVFGVVDRYYELKYFSSISQCHQSYLVSKTVHHLLSRIICSTITTVSI